MPDTLTSQSHLAIADKLKFWSLRYNGNLVLHVSYRLWKKKRKKRRKKNRANRSEKQNILSEETKPTDSQDS